jgi:hypothetical protein
MVFLIILTGRFLMSAIYNEIFLTQDEFMDQFDDITDSINDTTNTVWIIDHKAAFIPYQLFQEMTSGNIRLVRGTAHEFGAA